MPSEIDAPALQGLPLLNDHRMAPVLAFIATISPARLQPKTTSLAAATGASERLPKVGVVRRLEKQRAEVAQKRRDFALSIARRHQDMTAAEDCIRHLEGLLDAGGSALLGQVLAELRALAGATRDNLTPDRIEAEMKSLALYPDDR
jgi:uncharacterized protein involved in exopolysaccharide biosynthesis